MMSTRQLLWSLIILTLLLYITLGLFINNNPAYADASEIIQGNLVIKDNEIHQITNKLVMINGSIIIEENATLYLRNATLNFYSISSIILKKNSELGHPRLIVIDSVINVTSGGFIPIYSNHGNVTLVRSKVRANIIASNSSYVGIFAASELCMISLRNCSQLILTNITYVLPKVYLMNSTANVISSKIDYLNTQNSTISIIESQIKSTSANMSKMKTENVRITMMEVRDSEIQLNTSSVLGEISVYGCTNLTMIKCNPPNHMINTIKLFDNVSALITETQISYLFSYNYSKASLNNAKITGANSNFLGKGSCKADIFNSQIAHLTACENAQITSVNLTADQILAFDNSKIFLSKAFINEWIQGHGNSAFDIINSTILGGISMLSFSSLSLSNSTVLKPLKAFESSTLFITKSSLDILRVLHSSNVTISNSNIKALQICMRSLNGTINGFNTSLVPYWNLIHNNSIQYGPASLIPNITLENVYGPEQLNLEFSGFSNVFIKNAVLEHVEASDNTIITLENCTFKSCAISVDSQIVIYWYFSIHAVDLHDNPVANAEVTILDSKGNILGHGFTDKNGYYKYDVLVKAGIITSIGKADSLVLEVRKGDYFVRLFAVELTSGDVVVKLPIYIPLVIRYWYTILIIAVTIIAAFYFAVKKLAHKH